MRRKHPYPAYPPSPFFCMLRHPIDRYISQYYFFQAGLNMGTAARDRTEETSR